MLGGFVSAICCGAAEFNFGGLEQRGTVLNKGATRGTYHQAGIQLAAIAVTLCIAVSSGFVAGLIASRLPHPENIYDDTLHFVHVEYGDDTDVYNNTNHAVAPMKNKVEVEMKSNTIN
jgi:hypothetical protein